MWSTQKDIQLGAVLGVRLMPFADQAPACSVLFPRTKACCCLRPCSLAENLVFDLPGNKIFVQVNAY